MAIVDRFTSIIDAFDDTTVGLSLDQIAARASLPRSTTHRIINHLVRLDWLTHGEGGYGLGKRAFSWGAGDAADLRLRRAAAPVLHELHAATAAVVLLGVLHGDRLIHADRLGGLSVPVRVGDQVSARRSALGLAVLSALAPEVAEATLAPQLHRIRRDGVACQRDEYGSGLLSVAAAVDGRAAVGIVLPQQVSADRYRPLVMNAAIQIRRALVLLRAQ